MVRPQWRKVNVLWKPYGWVLFFYLLLQIIDWVSRIRNTSARSLSHKSLMGWNATFLQIAITALSLTAPD